MTTRPTRTTRDGVGRTVVVLTGAAIVFSIGAGLTARPGQAAAAPQPQEPAVAGRQNQPPAPTARGRRGGRGGRRGGANTSGPIRGESGAIIGYTGFAEIPGTPWRIHGAVRPQPRVVAPGATTGAPPADAIVLFDGTDLAKWAQMRDGQLVDTTWPIRDGFFETGAGSGSIRTRESFGDIQLHVEFATPVSAEGDSQGRGNSGVIIMGRYEVQVLDSFDNITYADGMAASIYGEYPPLVNAARKPGEWQTYDIVFEAPEFNGTTLVSPGYFTVIWNGVLVHNRRSVMGSTSATRTQHAYTPHEAELPLTLQDHANPVRYRNVWIRRLTGYDQP